MALIKCPECASSVSDKARACPQCGFPIQELKQRSNSEGTASLTDTPSAVGAGSITPAVSQAIHGLPPKLQRNEDDARLTHSKTPPPNDQPAGSALDSMNAVALGAFLAPDGSVPGAIVPEESAQPSDVRKPAELIGSTSAAPTVVPTAPTLGLSDELQPQRQPASVVLIHQNSMTPDLGSSPEASPRSGRAPGAVITPLEERLAANTDDELTAACASGDFTPEARAIAWQLLKARGRVPMEQTLPVPTPPAPADSGPGTAMAAVTAVALFVAAKFLGMNLPSLFGRVLGLWFMSQVVMFVWNVASTAKAPALAIPGSPSLRRSLIAVLIALPIACAISIWLGGPAADEPDVNVRKWKDIYNRAAESDGSAAGQIEGYLMAGAILGVTVQGWG